MFGLNKGYLGGFYRKTLSNMQKFWLKIERDKILNTIK